MEADDPWLWDVDRVVKEFCYSRTIWNSRPSSKLPDPAAFERSLRDQDIDGAALMTDVTVNELKEDLGIKSLGHRSNITWAILRLRNRSARLQEERPDLLSNFRGSSFSTLPVGSSFGVTSQSTYTSHIPAIVETPRGSPAQLTDRLYSGVAALSQHEHTAKHPDRDDDGGTSSRAGEGFIEDARGKKRRRLELGAPSKESRTLEGPDLASGGADQEPTTSTDKVTSIAQETVSAKKSDRRTPSIFASKARALAETDRHRFLGQGAFNSDDVFFEVKSYGVPVSSEEDIIPQLKDRPGTVLVYKALNQRPIYGRQQFVNRKMMHFLGHPQDLDVDEVPNDCLGLYPYTASAAPISGSRAVILLRHDGKSVAATRECLSSLSQTSDGLPVATEPAAAASVWDRLLHWKDSKHDADDKALPLYGDSGDDFDSDELDELELEMEADAATDQASREIDESRKHEIIDEQIKQSIMKWEREKLPIREERALTLWKKGRTPGGRLILADAARKAATHYSIRLEKLKGELAGSIWHSEAALVSNCQSMEETVIQIEEERFKKDVLLRSKAPPPPTGKFKIRKRTKAHETTVQEEHSLDSDDEVIDYGDAFAFENNDEAKPIPQLKTSVSEGPDGFEGIEDSGNSTDGKQDEIEEEREDDSDSVIDSGKRHQPAPTTPEIGTPRVKKEMPDKPVFRTPRLSFTEAEIIDLTFSSDAEPDETHPAARFSKSQDSQYVRRSDQPENEPDHQIWAWEWADLEMEQDRIRLIIKLLRTMPEDSYQVLRNYVTADNGCASDIRLQELADSAQQVLRKKLGHNVEFELTKNAYDRSLELLRLYVCWLENSASYFRLGYTKTDNAYRPAKLNRHDEQRAFEAIHEDEGADFGQCLGLIYRVLYKHRKPLIPIQDLAESDVSVEEQQPTPHKKRKRAVAESQAAKSLRQNVQQTRLLYDERSRRYLEEQSSQSATSERIVVNVGKHEDEPEIHLDPHIARVAQPHQIDGIRFLWREVVSATEDAAHAQGALLAHTMGLGKTMQSIAFLATLAKATMSTNPDIKSQIPKSLRPMRYLILCPAGLVQNWIEEFGKWYGPDKNTPFAHIMEIPKNVARTDRRKAILRDWYRVKGRGSVLIMSYELFRPWVHNQPTAKWKAPFSKEEHEEVVKFLLKGPSIIIADEAHRLKNNDSSLTRAAKKLLSRSRIALTGSPLSNNLIEYYAMIDWIAPGYLGAMVEFKANYVEPIQEGLYIESTAWERRKALVKLCALEEILAPKIDRKDISVLSKSLQPKIEFVLRMPLSKVQFNLYTAFVRNANRDSGSEMSVARFWAWMSYLRLLCNHPKQFLDKLNGEEEKRKSTEQASDTGKRIEASRNEYVNGNGSDRPTSRPETPGAEDMLEEPAPSQEDLSVAEKVSNTVLAQCRDLLDPIQRDPYSLDVSPKVKVVVEILKNSIRVGDKVLVFSQRIAILNYLGKIFEQHNIRYARLDGHTTMGKRQQMTKAFNDTRSIHAFLISTTAGAVGFNLYGANRVILTDFSFNPQWEEQAIGRAYRLGQKKPVFVYRIIMAGTFEEQMYNQTIYKLQLSLNVVEKKTTKAMATKLKTYLRDPQESTVKDLSGHVGRDVVLDSVIQAFIPGEELIHDVETTETVSQAIKEVLNDQEKQESNLLVADNKLRQENPAEWEKQRAARTFVPPTIPYSSGMENIVNRGEASYSAANGFPMNAAFPVPAAPYQPSQVAPRQNVPVPVPRANEFLANLDFGLRAAAEGHGFPDPAPEPASGAPGASPSSFSDLRPSLLRWSTSRRPNHETADQSERR